MGGATIRPSATGWRSGFDNQQHAPVDARTAACGDEIREQRYDRPDWPRCGDCIEVVGITVAKPTQPTLEGWAPGEVTEAFGR